MSNHTKVIVTIEASDKPYGVFVVNEKSREIIVGEPTVNYDGKFQIRLVLVSSCRKNTASGV